MTATLEQGAWAPFFIFMVPVILLGAFNLRIWVTHDARFFRRHGRRRSMIFMVSGVFGMLAFLLSPSPALHYLCWLAMFLDPFGWYFGRDAIQWLKG